MSPRSQPHRFLSLHLVCVAIALVAIDPRAAAADTVNAFFFDVGMTYGSGEPRYDGSLADQDSERISREVGLSNADVTASGGFVANANGRSLQSAVEVGALVTIDDDVFWDTLNISGISLATTTDVLTIEGPAGANGLIRFGWEAEGTLYHDLDHASITGGGYTIDRLFANGFLTLAVMGQGSSTPFGESFEPPTAFLSPSFGETRRQDVGAAGISEGFVFPFNTPFTVDFTLIATVELVARNLDAGEFSWLGGSGFENTAIIRGLAVYDEAGVPIANPMIHSASGLSYAIVPEASTLLLFAFGTAGLAVGARRGPSFVQRPPAKSAAASSARECTPSFSKIA